MTVISPIANPWAGGGSASIAEPGTSKKDLGWVGAEKPPHEYFNWILNNSDDKINEIISTYANPSEVVTFEKFLYMTQNDAFLLGADNGTDAYVLIFTSTDAYGNGKTRLYYSGGSNFALTINASWDQDNTVWVGDDTTSDAHLYLWTSARFARYYRTATLPSFWSSWTSTDELSPVAGQDSTGKLSVYREANGAYYYETKGALYYNNKTGSTITNGVEVVTFVPWGRRLVGVATGDVTLTSTSSAGWSTSGTLSKNSVSEYGVYVSGFTDNPAPTGLSFNFFDVVVDK